jgi:phosphate transport system substrate-binding protein
VNTTSRRRLFAGAIAVSLVLAACGDDDDEASDTTGGGSPATTMASDATEPATEPTTEGTDGGESTAPEGDLSGSINISGSSTVEPISIAAGDAFANLNPAVQVSVVGPGTSDGFAQFCAGETDISDASRPIAGDEVETCESNGIEFIELKVAVDGLSVITSAENTEIECLSFVDLWALLGPDATGVNNWADAQPTAEEVAATVTDLGAINTPYPDAELTVTAPGEESGTFDSFVEIVLESVAEELEAEDFLPRIDYQSSPNDNVIIEGIGGNPTSLGWVGFAFVEENLDAVRAIAVDGGGGCVEPTPETIASAEFPIARDLYIYVNVEKMESNPTLEAFVDFYVGEAITTLVGTEEGQVPYVPLAEEDVAATQAVWEAKETGTRDGGE